MVGRPWRAILRPNAKEGQRRITGGESRCEWKRKRGEKKRGENIMIKKEERINGNAVDKERGETARCLLCVG